MLTAILVFVILIFAVECIGIFMLTCLISILHSDLGEISSKLEE